MLFLQLQRGGHLVGQMLHGRLLALAEIMEAAAVVNLQHPHHVGLREHRNQQHGSRSDYRIFLLEVRAAPDVRNGNQRVAAKAGCNRGRQGRGRRLRIDSLHRGVVGVDTFQHFRRAVVDIEANAGGIRQRRKIQHQPPQDLCGRGGADHLLPQRIEQPHLFAQLRHAAFAEPPDGRQRAGQNQRSQKHRRLNRPAPLDHRHRRRVWNQDLEVTIVRRQRAVLAGNAGDADAIARAESAQFGALVTPRPGQEYIQLVVSLADQKQIAAAVLVLAGDDAFKRHQHAHVAKGCQVQRSDQLGGGRRRVAQTADRAGNENRQAGSFGNSTLRLHPIARQEVRQLRDLGPQQQPKKSFVLNSYVIRIGDPNRLGRDQAGNHDVLAVVCGNAVAAGARSSLFQGDPGLNWSPRFSWRLYRERCLFRWRRLGFRNGIS